jgi:hypothetical protein
VAKTAALLLGNQPEKPARPALLSLLKDRRIRESPELLAALITSLSRADYRPRDWKQIEGLFDRDFNAKYAAVQQAILALVITVKEKQAWRLLLDHFDEPTATFVDAADNPPAEYWERRWKAWRVWRADVKERCSRSPASASARPRKPRPGSTRTEQRWG